MSGFFCAADARHEPRILVITGPTATGKTALGAYCASELRGEVVSADSMQIYKYMDIGTAKPSEAEMLGVPHHMIDVAEPGEDYSAARYVAEASACTDDILRRGKLPVIVGGTGLYIDSLLSGRDFARRGDAELRKALEAEYDASGGSEMLCKLSEFDPEAAARLHANDKKRIVRAFEVYRMTGETITRHDMETKRLPPRYTAVKIGLTFSDRNELYGRIDRRVTAMLEAGLADEVRALLEKGVTRDSTAMQAIGYKELAAAIDGEYSFEDAVDRIRRESRRYAKRQLTWLRRDNSIQWLEWSKSPDLDLGLRFSTGNLQED